MEEKVLNHFFVQVATELQSGARRLQITDVDKLSKILYYEKGYRRNDKIIITRNFNKR